MSDTPSSNEFDLIFEGSARATGKMRCDVRVDMPAWGEHWDLATDEGAFHGGDASAPPPLALFTAGFAGCIMTQIRAFSKRLKIPVDDVRLGVKCHWKGEMQPDKTYHGLPVSFDLDVEIDSPASFADQKRLVDAAQLGCFIEGSLRGGGALTHRLKDDAGQWVSV